MLYPGLVSITYRQCSPAQIIALCVENGLSAIEWGGDIHVPHGDIENAVRIGEMTRAAGLCMPAYGTYYKAGTYGKNYRQEFEKILQTACALDTPSLRLWAGTKMPRISRMTSETRSCLSFVTVPTWQPLTARPSPLSVTTAR